MKRAALLLAAALLGLLGAASPKPAPAADEQRAFDAANEKWRAADYSSACREFSTFILKYPASSLLRAARMSRSNACLRSGSSADDQARAMAELREIADKGPDDWTRVQALLKLIEHGERYVDSDQDARPRAALALLATLARASGPEAKQAFEYFFALGLAEMRHGRLEPEALAAQLLALDPPPVKRDEIVYERSLRLLNDAKRVAQAEQDLLSLGESATDWGDRALIWLGDRATGKGDFSAALKLFERVAARNGSEASSAKGRQDAIKAPALSISVSYVELPQSKPQAIIAFRNLRQAKLTLFRIDPASVAPKRYFDDESSGVKAAKRQGAARSWTVDLQEPGPYQQGTRAVDFDSPGPGAFVLEARAGEQVSEALLHVTPYASVVKLAPRELLVWLSDAVTGAAAGGGRAVAYTVVPTDDQPRYGRVEAGCDESGLCRLPMPAHVERVEVWTGKGGAWTYAQANGNWWDQPERELLGYVLTDRPLYKPEEKVGVKLFLRSRGGGPSRPVAGKALRMVTHDPSGNEIDKRVVRPNGFGTASYEIKLKKDAGLGEYQISLENPNENDESNVEAGGGGFRVEEYKPPEFVVSVEPLGKPKPGEPLKVKISASLYSGGPISFADGRAVVAPRQWEHAFGPWPDEPGEDLEGYGYGLGAYSSRRPYKHYEEDYEDRAERSQPRSPKPTSDRAPPKKSCFDWAQKTLTFRTGEDGVAVLEVEPACAEAPEHAVDVTVFLTDLSRREVTGAGSVNLSHDPWYVDLKTDHFVYRPGERVQVRLRAEDANGRPEAPAVQLRLVRLDKDDLPEVLRKDVALVNGVADALLDADALGPVRVEVRAQGADPKETEPLAETDLWLTSETRPIIPPWDGMFVITDQRPAHAGSTLRALVVTPRAGGHVLVTLEGERVYTAQVVGLRGRARFVELPLTGAMTPAVTLGVSRFERLEYQQAGTELAVMGSEAPLEVKVRPAAGSTLPGSALPVDVQLKGAPAGVPVEVAFTAVDQAVFAIAPEQSDFATFFARQYDGNHVETETSLNQMSFRPLPEEPAPKEAKEVPRPEWLDATAGTASAGSGGSGSRAKRAPYSSKDMAMEDTLFGAPAASAPKEKKAEAESRKEAAHVAPAPNAPAAPPPVRVRSRFGSSGGWFPALSGTLGGAAQAMARFSDSLTSWKLTAYAVTAGGHLGTGSAIVRTELPLMVRLQGPRFFTERDEVVISAVVTSKLSRPTVTEVAFDVPGLKPLGPTVKRITVGPNREARAEVRYSVTSVGNERVRATARAGAAADAMEWTLPSIVHGVAKRTAFTGMLQDRFGFEVSLPEKRNPKGTRLALTVSPSLLGVMLDALPYLAEYPYGCVEQTLSRFVPAVAASRVVRELKAPAQRVPKDLDQMVDAGLKRLYGFQHGDGGWGWWEKDETDVRMTAYVIWGLMLAKQAGVKVPPTTVERGRAWLAANALRAGSPDDQAFVAFALAVSGEVHKKVLDAAFDARAQMSDRGKAFAVLALAAAKDARAKVALESLKPLFEVVELGLKGGRLAEVWDTCAGIEAVALSLMAANRCDSQDPRVALLTDFLVLRRKGNTWSTTRDTAFAVYALADVAIRARGQAADGSLKVMVNGKQATQTGYASGGADLKTLVVGDAAFKPGLNKVEVVHQGKATGHWAALFDVHDIDENVKAHDNAAVQVRRTYTVLGRPGAEKAQGTMEYGMAVESGERVQVDLELKVTRPLQYVMIEDYKAAGLEPVAQRSGPEVCNYQCTHAELRTDRVALFVANLAPGTHHYFYETRAEVPGRFHGLPTRVVPMYAPEVQATSDEMRIEVRDAPRPEAGVAKQ